MKINLIKVIQVKWNFISRLLKARKILKSSIVETSSIRHRWLLLTWNSEKLAPLTNIPKVIQGILTRLEKSTLAKTALILKEGDCYKILIPVLVISPLITRLRPPKSTGRPWNTAAKSTYSHLSLSTEVNLARTLAIAFKMLKHRLVKRRITVLRFYKIIIRGCLNILNNKVRISQI